ncbi:MAG: phytoene/squalene synthase family protein [Terracidiphilus sp.]
MTHATKLNAAYAACRTIAQREAKNFYYAFVALPKPRRDAICAIYAFMRQADDLADDESLPREERRRRLDAWLANWRGVCHGGDSSDLVFFAVRDAVERFNIPLNLLDELVAGVTMDLDQTSDCHPERAYRGPQRQVFVAGVGERVEGPASTNVEAPCPIHSASSAEWVGNLETDTYATFDDLYRYCYLVASVVGLVCIRIFGYTDPRAEKLAEETGIAFQLTNILRDVAEDASRNRVYLPLEDLAAHNVALDSLLHRAPNTPPTESERRLLKSIAQRAEEYYQSAKELLPLIDRESRPALWVLVSIYHGLLKRIRQSEYDVFSQRATVPMPQKLGILGVGIARLGFARLSG